MIHPASSTSLKRRLLALVFALGAQASFATTWVVDAVNGPILTINAALAVASPGDIILVRAGVYTEDLVLTFGVSIVGWNATTYPMTVPSNPFQDVVYGTVLVQNLGPFEKVVVSGMNFARQTLAGGYTFGAINCAGAVVFDRMYSINGGIFIQNSDNVLLQDVRVRNAPGADPPVSACHVDSSWVQGNDLNFAATDLGGEPNYYFNAPHAIEAVNGSVVSVCRPKLIGALGGGPWETSPSTPGGGSAIYCNASIVSVVSNGSGLMYMIGGAGGVRGANSAPGIQSGFGGPAIRCENNGTVYLKGAPTPIAGLPGANLAGGPAGFSTPAVFTLTNGSVVFDPFTPATMRVVGTTQPNGGAYIGYLSSAPFYPVVIAIASRFQLTPLPPAVQFLGIDLNSVLTYFTGTANSGRYYALGFAFGPNLVGIEGETLGIQGADVLANIFYLANPVVMTLP